MKSVPEMNGPDFNSFPHAPGASETDTRQRILNAAGDVFFKNGYTRATTRMIAKAAGVSEVTLFRYFDSKENLLRAALEDYGSPHLVRVIENKLTGDYRQDLLMMGNIIAQVLMERAANASFALSESLHFPEMRPLFSQIPSLMWQMLARYLRNKMDEGAVRALHPEAAAEMFFGAIYSYCMCKRIFELEPKPQISMEEAVAQMVDIFVRGTIKE